MSEWNNERMERDKMSHCVEQYEWMMDQMQVYKELEQNSGNHFHSCRTTNSE